MKVKQKLISLILSLTLTMGLATAPSFASSPDTSYFMNSQRYYWSGASGTHDLPSSTKLGNLVAMGINFLSLDLAAVNSSLGQLYSLVNTGLGTLNTTLTPISELKSGNWGNTLNLYAIPSGYGSSWYAQVLRGFYDIKDLNNSIKSLLYTSTGNQSTIINKLNSGITTILETTVEGYIKNSSEQLTTISGILNSNLPVISVDTSTISSNTTTILNRIDNFISIPFAYNLMNGWNNILNNVTLTSEKVPYYNLYQGTPRVQYTYSSNVGIQGYLDIINKNMLNIGSFVHTNYSYYPVMRWNGTAGYTEQSNYNWSLMDILHNINFEFGKSLSAIRYVIADPDTIDAKLGNKNQEQTALSNFTGSGAASASTSDFVGVKDSVTALKTSLSGGASYTQAFNILGGDSDGWSWFSQEVADSMDSTNSTRGLLRGDISSSTPYLDSYYDSIYSIIGIGGGIE